MRLAAVDIGTNTVRLLVADVTGGDLVVVDRDRAITRLGQAVDARGRLDEAAMSRTLEVAQGFVERARAQGAERVRVAGTSALRDAGDSERFARSLRDAVGAELELLTGEVEGRLSHLGATTGLPAGDHVVCDIGGGSTELSTSSASASLDIGSVRLTERFLRGDPPSASDVAAARAFVDHALSASELRFVEGERILIGVAGTITTVAALALGLRTYDRDRVHHAKISRADVCDWSERLLRKTADEIVALGPVERGRADVVGAGALILRAVMERWEHVEVLVSETDILDGLVLDLAQRVA